MLKFKPVLLVASLAALAGCQTTPTTAPQSGTAASAKANLDAIKTIVVIYAENRGFDHLYGHFPGANGLQNVSTAQTAQRDRDGNVMASLPPVFGEGLTDASDPKQITTEATRGHPNRAYALDDPNGYGVTLDYKLADPIHAFYQNQMQINGGKNDMFAAWSNAGGQTTGYFDSAKIGRAGVGKK